MFRSFPFGAALFDLDGVLADTTALHYRVWEEFALHHGRTLTQPELLATNGRRAEETLRGWFGAELSPARTPADRRRRRWRPSVERPDWLIPDFDAVPPELTPHA